MLGLIAFANSGGLGVQTKRLSEMLNPDRILVIDSSGFSPNKDFNLDWYFRGKTIVVKGFPKNHDIVQFVQGLTHILTVENPYNFYLIYLCNQLGIKTYCQTNYEFCENIYNSQLPIPTMFLMPSYWMLEDMVSRYGNKIKYLPPPINPDEFFQARMINMARSSKKKRFLHIIGTLAHKDRNGTLDLLRAVKLSKGDYQLVIHSQHKLPNKYLLPDERLEYHIGSVKSNVDLYMDYDALILPRRYGGLSLTTNEALMSGIPVMMTDISPNNKLLPDDWLVPSVNNGKFQARVMIDYYSAEHHLLANKIDLWASDDLQKKKEYAYQLGIKNFSDKILVSEYRKLFI